MNNRKAGLFVCNTDCVFVLFLHLNTLFSSSSSSGETVNVDFHLFLTSDSNTFTLPKMNKYLTSFPNITKTKQSHNVGILNQWIINCVNDHLLEDPVLEVAKKKKTPFHSHSLLSGKNLPFGNESLDVLLSLTKLELK